MNKIKLAQELPSQLLRLFKRFPPPQLVALGATAPVPTIQIPRAAAVSDGTNATSTAPEDDTTDDTITVPMYKNTKKNPFLPWKNPETGNWHGAHYSLRRQADLFKLAVKHNVLPLMPKSPKHPEVKEEKRLKQGVRVRGTGVGQRVKGHKWERALRYKLETRRKAMEDMPALIKRWKELGNGRAWKKWPK